MKILLNKTKSSRDRYYLISGSMGNVGCPSNHANNRYEVVNGIDRGQCYQGYMAVSYAINSCDYLDKEIKDKIKAICDKDNLITTQ